MSKSNTIEDLREKVERIISDNQTLRSEIRKLKTEKDRLTLQRRSAEEQVKILEQRVKTLETAASFAGKETNNRLARLRINQLLKEIDSCIALMNR